MAERLTPRDAVPKTCSEPTDGPGPEPQSARPGLPAPHVTPATGAPLPEAAPRDEPPSSNIRGIVAMIVGCASFGCGDTLMKLVAGVFPTSELLFIRGGFVALGAFLTCLAIGAFRILHRALKPAMLVRALSDAAGGWGFQLALARMPYADVSAITQLQPLAITAASALFLGERVGWRRWTATVVGLGGVLLIIRPGSSQFNWWVLGALVAVLASTVRDLSTRRVDPTVPPALIMLFSTAMVMVLSAAAAPFAGWSLPDSGTVFKLVGAALFSLIGQMCIIIAVRSGDLGAVAPFRYTIIIFAILSGMLVFGQLPDGITMIGIAIVVAAGLYTFYREQTLRRPGKST